MKNVLILAAHPDDEVLGCGGTIRRLKKEGSIVNVHFFTDGVSARDSHQIEFVKKRKQHLENSSKILGIDNVTYNNYPDNQMDTVSLLDITKEIEHKINIYNPDTIFTHYKHDLNIDHQIVSNATITACRPQPNYCVKKILFFEIQSSTEWQLSSPVFNPNLFIEITKHIDYKIKALKEYKDELRNFPHSRSIEAIKCLAQLRGSSIGVKYAESFVVGRYII